MRFIFAVFAGVILVSASPAAADDSEFGMITPLLPLEHTCLSDDAFERGMCVGYIAGLEDAHETGRITPPRPAGILRSFLPQVGTETPEVRASLKKEQVQGETTCGNTLENSL